MKAWSTEPRSEENCGPVAGTVDLFQVPGFLVRRHSRRRIGAQPTLQSGAFLICTL